MKNSRGSSATAVQRRGGDTVFFFIFLPSQFTRERASRAQVRQHDFTLFFHFYVCECRQVYVFVVRACFSSHISHGV